MTGETSGENDVAVAKGKAGISDTQAKRWQQLADIPDEDFEAELAGPDMPRRLARQSQASNKPIHKRALWLWDCLREFV